MSGRTTPAEAGSEAATDSERAFPFAAVDTSRSLAVRRLGTVEYAAGIAIQEGMVRQRRAGEIDDTLLLLEHPHVITLGSGARPENVLLTPEVRAERGIQLFETGRGGDVTYHGPGQLVGYPILDLKPDRCDLHLYLRDLEQVLIDTLHDFGVDSHRVHGLTGVWVGRRKLAAIGVRVSSGWITSHGFALNVSTDLSYFEAIIPCGIQDQEVGSIAAELGTPIHLDQVATSVERHFRRIFPRPDS